MNVGDVWRSHWIHEVLEGDWIRQRKVVTQSEMLVRHEALVRPVNRLCNTWCAQSG